MKVEGCSAFSRYPLDWSAEMAERPKGGVEHFPPQPGDIPLEITEFEKDCYALLDKWGITEIYYMRKTRICGVNVECHCYDKDNKEK